MTNETSPHPPSSSMPSLQPAQYSSRVMIFVICLAIGAFGAVLVQSIYTQRVMHAQANLTVQVVDALNETLLAGVDAETGQRGYLLTGDIGYLAPYERGVEVWSDKIARVRRLIEDRVTPEQKELLGEMSAVSDRKMSEMNRTIALYNSGDVEGALAVVNTDRGKAAMQDFREVTQRLLRIEESILARELARARTVDRRMIPLLALLGTLFIALLILAFWLERRKASAEFEARDRAALNAALMQSDLLMGELAHRVKNLFSVAMSIVALTGRGETDVKVVVRKIRDRIHALSLAHEASAGSGGLNPVPLRELLKTTLAPYRGGSDGTDGVVRMTGPDVLIPVGAVTPMGLILHELATNAVKYGSLSVPGGYIDLKWTPPMDTGRVKFTWVERGGPQVAPEATPGFGSRMMEQAVSQLGGVSKRTLEPEGLIFTVTFPPADLNE